MSSKMKNEVHERAKPRRKEDINQKRLDGETVLYDDGQQKVYSLNQVAAIIWELCDGQRSMREIAEEVAAVYEKDAREVADDVKGLIAEMAKMDLLSLQED